MTQLKDFNLALGVINNILICDREGNIVFIGDEIKSILFPSSSPFQTVLLDNFPDPADKEELLAKIEEVRREKHTCHFVFKEVGETVFIFPANYRESDIIVLSTKDQLLLPNKIKSELNERVKELQCLYNISHELELNEVPANAYKATVEHLVKAFQYPESVIANIVIDGENYTTGDCEASKDNLNKFVEDITANGEKRGEIDICYRDGAEFLQEEIKLIEEIAQMISMAVEKNDYRISLEQKRKQLRDQNNELKQLTDSLSTSNNKLNALFSAITDTLVVIDNDFNIDMSNKIEVRTGGKCHKEIFDSEDVCENCPTRKVFEAGEHVSEERKVGDQYFLLQSYPIFDNKGEVDRVIEICRNVAHEKHIEQQLIQSYKLASLGKLTAGVAHEINNPNTFIRGNINIINEAFDDIIPILDKAYIDEPTLKIARLNYELFKENISILLEDMIGGANRIKKIVDGLRNFARKDDQELTDDVDLNFIIQNNLRITEKEVRKHARIEEKLGKNLPTFKGSISKLEQVLMNLLVNASHAIEHDKGLIILETGYTEETNEAWVKVMDNGKGIDEKHRRQIFDPFFTTKRNRGGTGLGLSISYGIIQEHNGRIDIDSEVGKGTTFTISFPIKTQENSEKEQDG